MKFSKIVVAALSFNYSPWFVQGTDNSKPKVGPWELHPIGNDDTSTKFAVIDTGDGADPMIDVVLHVEGDFGSTPTIEVFTGGKESEACDLGNKILDGHEGYTYEFQGLMSGSAYDDLRVTSDGSIGQAEFKMKLHDELAWTKKNSDNPKNGTFKVCARLSKKHDGNDVSFVDTLIKVNVNAEGKFQTVEHAITVVGTSMKSLEESRRKEIGMESYLCGPSDSGNPEHSYKIGQSFSICVGPTEAEKNNYDYIAVVGFKEVTCAETIKVVEDGQVVSAYPEGYKKADGNVESGLSSFETIVTPKYYTGLNEASITCSGTVELSFTDPTPPDPKYTKMGCISLQSQSQYIKSPQLLSYTVGTEDDVKQCNDHCSACWSYFILGCPMQGGQFICYCLINGDGVEVSSETCSASKPGNTNPSCSFENVKNSAYEFGLGKSIFKYPAYKVTTRRRLTASFSTNSGDLLQRHLQESGNQADTSGSFGTEILLSREENADAAFGGLAAPAADTGGVPPSTVTATAVGAVVAAAASLVRAANKLEPTPILRKREKNCIFPLPTNTCSGAKRYTAALPGLPIKA